LSKFYISLKIEQALLDFIFVKTRPQYDTELTRHKESEYKSTSRYIDKDDVYDTSEAR